MSYSVNLSITNNETNETFNQQIDTSCPDCQKAIQHLIEVELIRDKRKSEVIFERIPLMLMVDTDYHNVVHFESMKMNILTFRGLTENPDDSTILEYAKENLLYLKENKVLFVKTLRNKFINPSTGLSFISLRKGVDVYNVIFQVI